ncbi:hypothetical protein SOVF_180260 [Spinacia oleracea]|nr:hypothetical protein SOVF_180260 [Spinacia oleracea]
MRNLSKSLQISSTLLRSLITHKPFPSSSTSSSCSETIIFPDPIPENRQNFFHDVNGLLSSKDPPYAMDFFKWAEKEPGFGERFDSFRLLLQGLMGLECLKDTVNYFSDKKIPDAKTVIQGLKDGSNRIEDSISCVEWMLVNNIRLWVPCVKHVMYESWEFYDKAYYDSGANLERYFKLARDKGVELDPASFSCAIGLVSQKPDSNAACNLLLEMKEKGWVPSEGSYTQAIIACVKQRNLMEALRLKDEMVSCGKPMNLVVATMLMKGYCVSGDLESALGLFEKLAELELSPNKSTFSVLIDGCCINGNMEKASELYDQMTEKGIKPSGFNVNSLIKGFLKARLFEKAYEMFNKAAESGLVDDSSLNSLLSCLCKDGNMDEAQKFWGMALQCGIEPNLQNYNNLILGYCRKGNVAMAHGMYVQMIAKGLNPNVVTFTILMNGHIKKGEVGKALKMFDEMLQKGIKCTDHAYNTIIGGLCKNGQRIDCTDDTYNSIIVGLCKNGQTSRARKILEDFIKIDKFVPSCLTYNSIVGGLINEGDLDSALSVYNEMGEKGVSPDLCTYTIFIDAFLKSNNFNLVLKMQNEMISKGLELDITAYGTLIDGCCQREDMKNACKLFNQLCEAGLSPNYDIYYNMIMGYRTLGNIRAALSFEKKMNEQGILPDWLAQ